MLALSRTLSDLVPEYRHIEYQAALAGIAISHGSLISIVVSPTGSGKTWMQALIAKYYCKQGKRVVIVEPSHNLRMQTILKLEPVDYKLQVMSIT